MPSAGVELLPSFISHFKRAIAQEMSAMRERMGSFEVSLSDGARLEPEAGKGGDLCAFLLASSDEKLVAGMECSLRCGGEEYLVRVETLAGPKVTLWSAREIALGSGAASLVIYPWFLYEKLCRVLDEIDPERFAVDRALALFGKLPPETRPNHLLRRHEGLNTSQRAAVRLCLNTSPAFVWGPPGTGKTTTLAGIAEELSAHKMRVLVLSTTNAAVDQALKKIASVPEMAKAIEEGSVVRIGSSEAPSFGAGLRELTSRLNEAQKEELDGYLDRRSKVDETLDDCERAIKSLAWAEEPFQASLFNDTDPHALADLNGIFKARRLKALKTLSPDRLLDLIRRRSERLRRLRGLLSARVARLKGALINKEQGIVDRAGLVLLTLTNAYFSPLLSQQRFDAVIVDEASMAVLPALFYAACLGKEKTIMVGDPCQLPSIVQSDASYVRQVMGRNIFEVALKSPLDSPMVALLDVQYRMHPVIGTLVSQSFYSGKLKHAGDMSRCSAIAGLEPFPKSPLVVLDTAGRTECQQSPKGQSRLNPKTAELCAALALQAAASGAGSVAIITPYADQARAIRALLKDSPSAEDIECSTVHRFQGRERDVIILDTVDAEPMKPGVLLSERGAHSSAQKLLNVAVSRARGKLIIVADVPYFKKRAPEGIVSRVITRALLLGKREPWKEG